MHYDVDGCKVVHATPNVQQAQLLFVIVMHSQLKNSLLDDTPYLLVNQIEVWAVLWPQIWFNVKGVAYSINRIVSHAQCTGALSTFQPVYIKLCCLKNIKQEA